MDPAVVEPVDVVERGPFDVFDVAPGSLAMDQLGLAETVEAFNEGIDRHPFDADRSTPRHSGQSYARVRRQANDPSIVLTIVAVAPRANRGDDVGGAQAFGVANAEVLSGFKGSAQRIGGQWILTLELLHASTLVGRDTRARP